MRDGLLPQIGEPMFELHVLGTSSARFAHGRAVSGNFLMTPGGSILIDCGEGMQQRLLDQNRALRHAGSRMRARMAKVKAILLTHGHLDHCWGLLPLLRTMALDGRTEPLTIVGPTSTEALKWVMDNPGESPPFDSDIDACDLAILFHQWMSLGSKDEEFPYKIDWVLVPLEGEEPMTSPVQPLDGIELVIVPTKHGIPSCGWMAIHQRGVGKFDRAKADSLGLSKTQISSLASGEDVNHDGEVLVAADFRGEPRPPRSVMISGDTVGGLSIFERLPATPDVLLHEATFLSDKQSKAGEYNHSTAHDAARHALACQAGVLALTHYSSRIEDESEVEREAREIFERSFACVEGDIFIVESDGEVALARRSSDWS